jgi:hypothetical protein
MSSISTFANRVPGEILRSYFETYNLTSADSIDWSDKPRKLTARIKKIANELSEDKRARLLNDIERMGGMSDDAGQAALLGVLADRSHVGNLPGRHARSAWIFINEPALFRRAEESRYTDERRRGRTWSGYIGEKNLSIRSGRDELARFKDAIRNCYKSKNVHLDVFEREKTTFKKGIFRLSQVTIYRDGLPDDVAEIENDMLAWRPRRPVYEAAVTYEPESGSIEVVADDRESHALLATAFAREILGVGCGESPLPLREYELDILLRPYDFPTDPEDGIESVHLTQLRLMPVDSEGEKLTLECSRRTPHTIWDMASQRFGKNDPLVAGWIPTKAKLVVRFRPEPQSTRSKVLPVTLSFPHGCDLKDRTIRESMIGAKYLARWQLLKDV